MIKALNEERLRKLIRRIVREELEKAQSIQVTSISSVAAPEKETSENKNEEKAWAVIGSAKPDPNKKFHRIERPRALPGWSDTFQHKDDFNPAPFRPWK